MLYGRRRHMRRLYRITRGHGGQKSKGYPGSNKIEEVLLKKKTTYPIGQTKPNELGFYDFAGNVAEYCYDWYSPRKKCRINS